MTRKPLFPGRQPFPFAFELAVLVLLAAVGAGLVWFFGRAIGGGWKKVAAPVLFTAVRDVHPDAMDLEAGPDGRIWLLTKYGLSRFEPGSGPRERILDGARFHALFGRRMNALSTLRVTSPDGALVGGWHGELFEYQRGAWRQVAHRGRPFSGRIRAIAVGRDGLYAGGREGLWRWSDADAALTAVPDAPPGDVNALETDAEGRLMAAVGASLWRRGAGGWERVWTGSERDGQINGLASRSGGGWLLGTDDGVAAIGPSGEMLGRGAADIAVYGIAQYGNALWLATWGQGLVALMDGTVVPVRVSLDGRDTNVTDVLVDSTGMLWLTLYGRGAALAPVETLSALLRAGGP